MTFHELHVEPLLENRDAVWVAPMPMALREKGSKDGEPENIGGIEANDTTDGCRHPFGLLNPPDPVWEAHRKLVLGEGSLDDQKLVDEFAEKNAFYASGLGEQKSLSPGLKVRRPRYSPSLARQRRLKKELESKQSKYQT